MNKEEITKILDCIEPETHGKTRFYLFQKKESHGSLKINFDLSNFLEENPEYYEVSALWYYVNKMWHKLNPRALRGFIERILNKIPFS